MAVVPLLSCISLSLSLFSQSYHLQATRDMHPSIALDPSTNYNSPKFRSRNQSYMRAVSTLSQASCVSQVSQVSAHPLGLHRFSWIPEGARGVGFNFQENLIKSFHLKSHLKRPILPVSLSRHWVLFSKPRHNFSDINLVSTLYCTLFIWTN